MNKCLILKGIKRGNTFGTYFWAKYNLWILLSVSLDVNMPILIDTPVSGNLSNLNSSQYANLISRGLFREIQFRLMAEKV